MHHVEPQRTTGLALAAATSGGAIQISLKVNSHKYVIKTTPLGEAARMSLKNPRETGKLIAKQRKRDQMNPELWHKVAAVSGMAALGLGTYGAHIFKPKNPAYKEVWQTASLYHLVHTAALLAAPVTKHPNIFGGLLAAGILAFSGTCYTVALLEDRKYATLAPFGGFAFIAAWGSLLF